MSKAKSKPPDFRPGEKLLADKLQELSDWCWRNRIVFGDGIDATQSVAGIVASLANFGDTSSTTIVRTAVATTAITAASSLATYPVTYGSGSAKLDIDGATTCTQDSDTITLKNRFPTAWASGDLFVVRSGDGGRTWFIVNRYCP